MYTREQVEKESLEYFNGDNLACSVFIDKYALKNQQGEYFELTPEDMFIRLAKQFTRIEDSYVNPLLESVIFNYFNNWEIVPQGSVLNVVGNPYVKGSPANCAVINSPLDSYSGILYTDTQLASLFKRRYGAGVCLDNLRPIDAPVDNPALTSTGVVSFAERYSNTTREVGQNGRRGALMLTLSVYHPDILHFIDAKLNLEKITGANISVKVDNRFMYAVQNDEHVTLRWPLENTKKVQISKEVKAREVWDKLIDANRRSAEPGLAFIDTIHNYSPSECYPHLRSVTSNPCSEIWMPLDSCRLIAINLFKFVDYPFTSSASFNFDKFGKCVYDAQRLMDDLVDIDLECTKNIIVKIKADPEPTNIKAIELETMQQFYDSAAKYRRTGLGILGLADTFAALGYDYTSGTALEFADTLMHCKMENEFASSIDMAIERGEFTDYNEFVEEHSDFIKFFKVKCPELYERMRLHGRRNVSISTIAPTGSIAILAQVSSGMEPVYELEYVRRKKVQNGSGPFDYVDTIGDKWTEHKVIHPPLYQWLCQNASFDVKDSPYNGNTAHDIDPLKKLELHAILQKYTTHSISNTYNLPENTTCKTISDLYFQAWKKGIKGITIYVEGSRSGVLVSNSEHAKQNNKPIKRPTILPCTIHEFKLLENGQLETWLAYVGLYNGKPYEIFIGKKDWLLAPVDDGNLEIHKFKKDGYNLYYLILNMANGLKYNFGNLAQCFNMQFWNYSKFISGLLRHNMPIELLVRTVESMRFEETSLHTWQSGVVRVLKSYIIDGTVSKNTCESCGNVLIFTDGCLQCKQCGWSKC